MQPSPYVTYRLQPQVTVTCVRHVYDAKLQLQRAYLKPVIASRLRRLRIGDRRVLVERLVIGTRKPFQADPERIPADAFSRVDWSPSTLVVVPGVPMLLDFVASTARTSTLIVCEWLSVDG